MPASRLHPAGTNAGFTGINSRNGPSVTRRASAVAGTTAACAGTDDLYDRAVNKAQLAEYLDSARITGEVATPRENNLDHFQGFIDGVDTLAFGVDWKRDWTYDEVFDLMHEKVGTSADRSLHSGQDTISSALCVAALERFADRLGLAATRGEHVLFATGHPGGLLPVHAALAAALGEAGGKIVRIDEGFRFGDGDIRQISGVVMWHQHGHLMHTHLPGPMDLTLARLAAGERVPPTWSWPTTDGRDSRRRPASTPSGSPIAMIRDFSSPKLKATWTWQCRWTITSAPDCTTRWSTIYWIGQGCRNRVFEFGVAPRLAQNVSPCGLSPRLLHYRYLPPRSPCAY